ncbi:pyridoxamine 5'-phosphate oxidase family protein [Aeromicrobium wangtongii]|uniref:Pyridoxamine 5'-phosphate oxidase family protein n=1 Tax=Aeromicrobium wangtongii TaxID=2969247 RepID=A0ABY5M6E3_9ACTN|nr:pyridoxamine 5'-phosphate oxidase family protein [Aeromicrobium wangtongii]MCD9198497.1 pyridoxamine 5'-phosphate oxidase family protein [Aeromicrobium wangtongii]UUP12524.1 pyridoxamine 5'-phosphate oxidase family protein [Aeromicrobium wangtongii]
MTDATRSSFTALSEQECRDLLGTTTVGRVAFVNDEGQQLLPVNFAVRGHDIYFRTTADSVLAELGEGHDDVAFGADFHDDTYQRGWNVTVVGSSDRVDDPALISELLATARPRPWAPGERDVIIVIHERRIGGRRVRQH